MSEPTSPNDPTRGAPSYTYDRPAAPTAPAAPVAAPAPAPAPAERELLPPPQYGERLPGYEYATPTYPAYDPAAPVGPAASAVRPVRRWDRILTIVLLGAGAFGMFYNIATSLLLSDPTMIDQVLAVYGLGGGFQGDAGVLPIVGALLQPVLYAITVVVSVLLLRARRVAFWVPLTAGVVAYLALSFIATAVLLSDPTLLQRIGG